MKRFYSSVITVFLTFALLLTAIGAVAGAEASSGSGGPIPSLATVLNPDGTLRPEAQGSFNAQHFEMLTAPDGRPMFRPASTTGVGDERWSSDFTMAGPNGTVYTVVQAGTSLYIGGQFLTVANIVARNIAKWDGTSWSALGTGTNQGIYGIVYALAVAGTDLYVGGRFSQTGTVVANNIAKWNGSGWNSLGAGITGNQFQAVRALAWNGTTLFVGGSFSQAGGVAANNVAQWDGTNWNSLGWGAANGIANIAAGVEVLTVSGSDVYVGGDFLVAGGQSANRIAKWDGSAWSSLGSGIGTSTNGAVRTILVSGTDVYVGGGFRVAGGQTVDCLAKWNGSSWSRVGGVGFANGASNGSLTTMVFVGNDLYVAGYFEETNGAVGNYLAKWNGTMWQRVGTGLAGWGLGASALALLTVGADVYVAGRFTLAGSGRADNIARWDGSAWHRLGNATQPTQGIDNMVYTLAVAGNELYAGGAFAQAGVSRVEGIARWNGTAWSPLYTGVFAAAMQVRAVAVVGTNVYVGGNFFSAGPIQAANVAKWDGTSWSSLGSSASNGVNGAVSALAVVGNDVYVGGRFTQAGGISVNNIAKWNGTSWSPVGSATSNGVTHPTAAAVNALAVSGATLYVGGQFSSAAGVSVSNLAKWDGTTWSSVGSSINGFINALATSGTTLYVGGRFTSAGGNTANNVAK